MDGFNVHSGSESPEPIVGSARAFGKDEEDEEVRSRSGWLLRLKLEPVMFFHMVGLTSLMVTVPNFYLERICLKNFQMSAEVCANLTVYEGEEKEVEAVAADYNVYRQFIEAGFPVIFALFVGPWIDKYGSKTPLLLAIGGYFASTVLLLLFSLDTTLPPWILLFSSIPIALTGGMVAIVMSVFSSVSSTTSEKNRSYRIALIEGAWWSGSPIGLVGGAAVAKYFGHIPLFFCSAAVTGIAFVLGYYLVDNPKKGRSPNDPQEFCSELFNIGAVKDMMVTCFRERSGSRRAWILLLVLVFNLRLFSMVGIWNVFYLFTRNKLGWDRSTFSTFAAIDSLLGVMGLFLMTAIMMKLLALRDNIIVLIGSVFYVLSNLVLVVASSGFWLYLASLLQIPSTLMGPSLRSTLSKCVPKRELGKIFSFLSIGEAVIPLIAAPIYNQTYKSSISTFPGSVFLISVGVSVVIVLIYLYLTLGMEELKPHEEFDQRDPKAHFSFRQRSEERSGSYLETESEDDTGLQMGGSKYDRIEIISITT